MTLKSEVLDRHDVTLTCRPSIVPAVCIALDSHGV